MDNGAEANGTNTYRRTERENKNMETISTYISGQKYSDKVRNAVRYGYLYRKEAEKHENGSSHACLGETSDVLLWLANLIVGGMLWDGIKAIAKKLYSELKRRGSKCDEVTEVTLKKEVNLKVFYEMVVEFNEHRLTISEEQLKYMREEIIVDYCGNEIGKILGKEKRLPTIDEYKRIYSEAILYADELLKRREKE